MMNKTFDIKKRSYNFSIEIIKFLQTLPNNYTFQVLGKQLLRSATSIGANIIEAQAGSSRNDFKNFVNHALKSANETKYWLLLIQDSIKINNSKIKLLISESEEICRILGASMLKIKSKK